MSSVIDRAITPSSADNAAGTDRNSGIDALRGMSILFVILNHVGIRIPLAKTALATLIPAWLLQRMNYNGYEAVFIFFVISGFLITRRSQERWGDLRYMPPRKFYLLRAARIVPCLLLVIALLSLSHLLAVPNFVIDKPEQSLPAAITSALGLYLNWYESLTGYLPGGWDVLWSLSIEEVFYIVFPLVCLTLGRSRWLLALSLGVLALSLPFTRAAIVGNEIWLEKAYLPGMSAIAIGVLTAMFAARFPSPKSWLAPLLCVVGIAGIGTVLFAGSAIWHLIQDGAVLLLCVSAAILVLGLHWQAASASPWQLRWLGWLRSCGRLSYEIYLFHMFCVFGVIGIAHASGFSVEWGFIWYVPALGLSWLLGWMVARGFSVPCERWVRRRFGTSTIAPS
ncbi:acyltransferase [Pseudolysobacter antarcticus]|uniref:Acyltransferase n=1 Tax=Pseudolysobacter antarcticus TaxID=2511995 RepID=A0A411HH27_9GAMM|nr:acyltransferase [Pseudolysobacter antarcticus]QBB69799.1 acyltransferase [Pseudolysobacter antarcticus]